MTILGIKRGNLYSPNHITNDSIIFDLVFNQLEYNYDINIISEQDIFRYDINKYNTIVTMVRNPIVIKELQKNEKKNNTLIINSAFGIENCFRSNITRIFLNNNIPTPPSKIISTSNFEINSTNNFILNGYWIKRGDFHAIEKEDVSFARNKNEIENIIHSFYKRGISEAVISENIEGDLVKFYGVFGTPFFYSLYPYEINHYKYQEFQIINGATNFFPFNKHELKNIAEKIAKIANVPIYGGDAVIDKDGAISIIDFNDWPSFAPCREEAAKHISVYIKNQIDAQQ